MPSHESAYPGTSQSQTLGLGLFGCSLPPSQSAMSGMVSSPERSSSWSSSMIDNEYSQSSQPPDIFSTAFNPFSDFSASSNTGMASVHSPEAPGLEYCPTPPSSNLQSHRSSISSSYAPSETYSQHDTDFSYVPRVKMEDGNEWYPSSGNEDVLQRALSTQGLPSISDGTTSLTSSSEDTYNTQSIHNKTDSTGFLPDIHTSNEDQHRTLSSQISLPSVSRIKKKRQRTTPEEATHECRVCGKLFKRSYNWKSHMETHNPERKYPHPCNATVGNSPCTKKFQRKTDLDRHYDSVHLKTRNHRCTLCGHRFARRDTLRRHTEDGCPKRFELGFREGSVATPARWSFTNFPTERNRSFSLGMGQPPLATSAVAATTASSMPFSILSRPFESPVHNVSPAIQP